MIDRGLIRQLRRAMRAAGLVLVGSTAAACLGYVHAQPTLPGEYIVPGERTFPESIALDHERDVFYVGSADQGTLFRGRRDAASLTPFVAGRSAPSAANGLALLPSGDLLVAGGRSGSLFVYAPNGTLRRRFDSPATEQTFINDLVVVSPTEAYVTDSFRPTLFRVDPSREGALEAWLDLTQTPIRYADGFNLNGVVATADGRFLIAAQTNIGKFWRIDRRSKVTDEIRVLGGEGGGDGLRLRGNLLYAVNGGGLTVYDLSSDASEARVLTRLTDLRLNGPTGLALDGDDALVVNAQFSARESTPDLPFTVTRLRLPKGQRR
jgi:superoxide dismutase, Cu-Zn family